ncbi:MAG: tetratricopeptide repeat protein, partial [Planctomycetes bacterium]|nr:tetratricopeptide repeat protein [Planctomycetota bacterium]
LVLLKRFSSALEVIAPLLEESSLKDEASLLAAQAHVQLGQWPQAKKRLNECRESGKDSIRLEAEKNLGMVYYELKEYDDALGMLKQLVEREVPLDYRIEIKLQMAEVYFGQGDAYMAQDIYNDLMHENNRSLEPGLHYNLARCAMVTNPLVECFFMRDKYKEKGLGGSKLKKAELNDRVLKVLTEYWTMVSDGETDLSKNKILEIAKGILGLDFAKRETDFTEKFKKIYDGLPKPINIQSDLFRYICEEFQKKFYDEELFPSYNSVKSTLGELGSYYPYLQAVKIKHHLNKIIMTGMDTPFMALAHYEKAMFFKRRNQINDAIESLEHAIRHAVDPDRRSTYLLQLARTQRDQAKQIGKIYLSFSLLPLGKLKSPQIIRVEGPKGSVDLTFAEESEGKAMVKIFNQNTAQTGVAATYKNKTHSLTLYLVDYDDNQILRISDRDGQSDLLIKPGSQLSEKKYVDVIEQSGEDANDFSLVGERLSTVREALENINEVDKLGVIPPARTYKLKYSCLRLIRENQEAEKVLQNFLQSSQEIQQIAMAENDLISFYLEMGMDQKAAKQKLHFADLVKESDSIKSQKLIYEAAEILIENAESFEEAMKLFLSLTQESSMSEWSFRAGLKSVSLYFKKGDGAKGEALLSSLAKVKDLNASLLLERDLLYGQYRMKQENEEEAALYFQKVISEAKPTSLLRAEAFIEYGKLLKKRKPLEAANVFLKFYYLFERHPKREQALYQSCRLRVMEFNPKSSRASETKKEIEVLISKLTNVRERKSLLTRLSDES